MATLDLSNAKASFYMDDPKFVSFGTLDGAPTASTWSWLTPAGHRVTVTGTGMTFDGAALPQGVSQDMSVFSMVGLVLLLSGGGMLAWVVWMRNKPEPL